MTPVEGVLGLGEIPGEISRPLELDWWPLKCSGHLKASLELPCSAKQTPQLDERDSHNDTLFIRINMYQQKCVGGTTDPSASPLFHQQRTKSAGTFPFSTAMAQLSWLRVPPLSRRRGRAALVSHDLV